jgi:UDP-glucose 4-epimerase
MCERFLQQGWDVDVIDDLSKGKREQVPPAARLHVLDVRSPEAASAIQKNAFDAIVHLAAQMDVRHSVADPLFDASVNIVGSLNLLEALRASPGAKQTRFIFASTGGAVYGDFATPPSAETIAKDPESPYAISKLSVEHYLAYYGRVHGMTTVALRFANVYGPRQDPHGEAGVVAIFCGRILEQRPLTVFGDGRQTRDYVYVRDAAQAAVLAATAPLPPAERLDARAFNIGTGVGTSVVDLAQSLLRVAGTTVPIEFAPRRAGEQEHSVLDVRKAREQLGWTPSVDLETGLRESFTWFAERDRTPASRS